MSKEPTAAEVRKAIHLLVEFANRFARHDDDCQWPINHTECTCGFDEMLRMVADAAKLRFTPEDAEAMVRLWRRLGLDRKP